MVLHALGKRESHLLEKKKRGKEIVPPCLVKRVISFPIMERTRPGTSLPSRRKRQKSGHALGWLEEKKRNPSLLAGPSEDRGLVVLEGKSLPPRREKGIRLSREGSPLSSGLKQGVLSPRIILPRRGKGRTACQPGKRKSPNKLPRGGGKLLSSILMRQESPHLPTIHLKKLPQGGRPHPPPLVI